MAASRGGDDLRNYRVLPTDPGRKTELEQLFAEMDAHLPDGTPHPCPVCGLPVRHNWLCWKHQKLCKHSGDLLVNGWIRRTNGSRQAFPRCRRCGVMPPSLSKGATIDNVCVRDNVTSGTPPCGKCLSTEGVEVHHWAPAAIFPDSDEWPVSYLCKDCHTKWHNAMRAAGEVA